MSDRDTFTRDGLTYNLERPRSGGRVAAPARYGSFEIFDEETGGEASHVEGGLWVDASGTLSDYDGIWSLPAPVVAWLEAQGVKVPEECGADAGGA